MTFEEWFEKKWEPWIPYGVGKGYEIQSWGRDDEGHAFISTRMKCLIKEGFEAGLNEGRPKWHFLSDGDYPPSRELVLVLADWFGEKRFTVDYWDAKEEGWGRTQCPLAWQPFDTSVEDKIENERTD